MIAQNSHDVRFELTYPARIAFDDETRGRIIEFSSLGVALLVSFLILIEGFSDRSIGPRVPNSLIETVLAKPVPTQFRQGDIAGLASEGHWSILCATADQCAMWSVALDGLDDGKFQIRRISASERAELIGVNVALGLAPVIDPRGWHYATINGERSMKEMRSQLLQVSTYFEREVLSRMF